MKKCSNCGAYMPDDSLFCSGCGTPLKKAVETNKKCVEKYIPYIIGAFALVCIIGYFAYCTIDGKKTIPPFTEVNLQVILNKMIGNGSGEADEQIVNRYCTERFKISYKEACKKAEDESCESPRLWWQYSDSDPEKYEIEGLEMVSDTEAKAKVKVISELYVGDFEVILKYENDAWLVDEIIDKGTDNNSEFAANTESESPNYDWLQGHWVYEQGNYKGHYIISGNTIVQFSSMNPEHESRSFYIDGDMIRASIIDGMELVVQIDFENQRIDYGDGRWMHKIDSSSSEEASYSSDSYEKSSPRTFINEQYVVGYLANQRFRANNGFTIRFDGNGGMFCEGDYAGIVSVLRYTPTSALLRYGGGQYSEGQIIVKIVGHKLQLTDPVDGTDYYQ
jgi:hypothetical protein